MSFISDVIFDWGVRCFGLEHMTDKKVRAARLLEEAVELCQSVGVTADQSHMVVSAVYMRPAGDEWQELGGVLVCAYAYASCRGFHVEEALEHEVKRCLSRSPEHFAKRNQEKLDLGLTG